MTNTHMLRAIINEKGIKYSKIADELGISSYALQKKIENRNEFKPSEINKLCNILSIKSLQIKENIFFTNQVD